MKQARIHAARRSVAGFTMVELLVATTLGLVILVAVTNIFVSSRQSYRTQEGLTQVQETGRLLNYLVYPYIRLAGYLPTPRTQTDPLQIFVLGTSQALEGANNDTSDPDVKNGTDTITVRYRGQNLGTSTTADGSITNCAGIKGDTGVSATELVRTRFYVSTADARGISSLICDTSVDSSNSAQPILEGVQDMQVEYGAGTVDASTLDRVTQRYYTADAVPDWTAITAVKVTITVDSIEKNVASTTGSTDGRLRRTFTSTLQIRNRLN